MIKPNQWLARMLSVTLLSLSSTLAFADFHMIGMGANADDMFNGPYVSAFLGANKPLNETYSVDDENFYTLRSDWGFVGGGAFGYRYQNFRVELGLDYAISHDDSLSATVDALDEGVSEEAGKQKVTAVMLNGIYDCNNSTNIVPYVGFGIGWAHIRHDFSFEGDNIDPLVIRANDNVFAYEGRLGVGWDILDNLIASIDYRLLATSKADLKLDTDNTPIDVRGHYTSHRINVGLTYFM